MTDVVIAGCGYTGRALAGELLTRGHRVTGIVHSAASAQRAVDAGIDTLRADLRSEVPPAVTGQAVIIYLAPPPGSGDRDSVLDGFLATRGTAGPDAPTRLVYTSTSGVYGDCAGARVDEDRPPAPRTGRAIRRLAAETALREWCGQHAVDWIVLRVAGIYGPGRLPLERLRRREPVLADKDAGPGNRIHRDDLVRACCAAIETPLVDRVFNVADGNHASATAFVMRVARLAGLPAPPTIDAAQAEQRFSARRWSFLAESRRLDNRRLTEDLGVQLAYADLDAGIRAALADGGNRG